MSDEQFESKRERQKARRAERLERESAVAKTEGRRRTMVTALAGLVVLVLVGGLIFVQINSRRQESQQADEVAGRLEELGCTEDIRMPDLGGGHIAGSAEALAAEPPEVIYTGGDIAGQPPSSGRHIGQVVASGSYELPIDPRLTTHNLEHGYIVVNYSPDAPAEQVAEAKAWVDDQLSGDFPKMVMAEYYEPLPDGANFSFTGWFQRQTCDTFDADVAEVFTRAHYDISGEGPEKGIPAHNIGGQGVVDPDGEPVFFPPLDAEFGTAAGVEELEDLGNASDADPTNNPPGDDGAVPEGEASE